MFLTTFLFYKFMWLLEGSGIKMQDFNLLKYPQITYISLFLSWKYSKYHSFPEKTDISGSVSFTPEALNVRSGFSHRNDVNP